MENTINFNKIDILEITNAILKINYPTPKFYDTILEDSQYFKKLIKEANQIRPSEKLFLESTCFNVAIRLIVSDFLMYENHFLLSSSVVESEIAENIDMLHPNDLLAMSNYIGFYKDFQWHETKEYFYKTRKEFIEIVDFETISNTLKIYILEIVEKYLFQLKAFFKFNFDKSFWYRLYDLDKSDYSEADLNYQTEKIDDIVVSILG